MLYSPWHCKESDTTKRLLLTHSQNKVISSQVALVVKNPPTNAGVGKPHWRKKWQLTPVFLSRKFHGQRSLVGSGPWGHKEA